MKRTVRFVGQHSLLAVQIALVFVLLALFARSKHAAVVRARKTALSLTFAVLSALFLATCKEADSPPASSLSQGSIQELIEDDEILFADQIGSLMETTSASGKARATTGQYAFGLTRFDSTKVSR